MRSAEAFAARLGLALNDPDLLDQALTHSSYLHEHRDSATGHNERLEFLGDAVVTLVIAEALFRAHPEDDEGVLSARRAAIVSAAGLAELARRIDLGEALFLGEGESRRDGRTRGSLLASAFEAVVGAIYLDLGFDAVRAWLLEIARPELERSAPPASLKSAKSRLQEYTQRMDGQRPAYRIVETTGPDHDKRFLVEVAVSGRVLATGEGTSQKIAEIAAAEAALPILRAEVGDDPALAAAVADGDPAPAAAVADGDPA
jgi:ribonuclease-3